MSEVMLCHEVITNTLKDRMSESGEKFVNALFSTFHSLFYMPGIDNGLLEKRGTYYLKH